MPKPSVRVLLVEDDEDDFILTRDLLDEIEGADYNVHWISQFDEALERFKSDYYDVILIDYFFGGRTGIELVQEAIKLSLAEDSIDLAAFNERKKERSLPFEDVVKKLRKNGRI